MQERMRMIVTMPTEQAVRRNLTLFNLAYVASCARFTAAEREKAREALRKELGPRRRIEAEAKQLPRA